ncbi:AraC family transcriptional regulator [Dyella sp. A6]|uniref:AraC family transcriptional regulator n=1 Tax=Dyella aluminiiresistens TaxID=3069105 RepID=UPI002E79CE33|nr:AraC family transcriptional regulator [Dyella sp. A6]
MGMPDQQHCRRGLSQQTLHRIDDFIEQALAGKIALDDLAKLARLSRFHFVRTFRKTMGISPMEYVLRARIRRSQPMLLSCRHTVADVAVSLGFCDQSHFTRSFRRVTGYPPRRFIAECRSAESANA